MGSTLELGDIIRFLSQDFFLFDVNATNVFSFQVQPGYHKYLRPLMNSNKAKL